MKKILLPSLLASVAGFATSMVFGYLFMFLFPSLKAEYENANLFRPWSDPLMMLMFLHPFYMGFVMAWIWTKVKTLFSSNVLMTALCVTCVYFLASTLPGMLMTISSFPVSMIMVCSWTVGGFFQILVMSLIIAKMVK